MYLAFMFNNKSLVGFAIFASDKYSNSTKQILEKNKYMVIWAIAVIL